MNGAGGDLSSGSAMAGRVAVGRPNSKKYTHPAGSGRA